MSHFAGVLERVETDPALASLRPIFAGLPSGHEGADAMRLLDELSSDVLRGGPNPAMTIPIAAAMDRFAAEQGVVVVRAAAASIAQRAEASLGKKVFSCAVPVLLSADGVRLAKARALLREALDDLRSATVQAFAMRNTAGVGEAARAYTRAFLETPGVVEGDDDEGRRVRWGYVSVVGAEMPGDCVLRSSKAAVRTMRGDAGASNGGSADAPAGRVRTLIVKEMSLRPE